ncbi:hypothetical protein [Oceanidesulfovibrio marinus]|uniref:Uncharacterized protein n=1 Tax=Oceanidesulfovibrio marinus TaxID=370038 RepID=A0A6P1ZQC4_9BACT|nr:hypothetical protein [Oceanidesulfovibrio marinus]TVM36707.1 hypothetical protein DQK91_01950 [Oceanidesulfovibrio marinus]
MPTPQPPSTPRAVHWLGGERLAPRSLYHGHDQLVRLAPGSALLYRGRLWCIVRTSRLAVPFWGVKRHALSTFEHEPYALLLLDGPGTGWCLPRIEVEALLRRRAWPVSRAGEYKIKPANLCESSRFTSTAQLFTRLDAFVAMFLEHARCGSRDSAPRAPRQGTLFPGPSI